MNMKKISILLTISLISLFLVTSSSWAGAEQRHRWEGVAIGIGAAVLGNALLHQYYTHHAHHAPAPARVYYKRRPRRPRGHWEYRKVWVPPTYRKVWNPGHYNKRGRWIRGRWIKIQKDSGYWTRERIWVTSRKHRRH